MTVSMIPTSLPDPKTERPQEHIQNYGDAEAQEVGGETKEPQKDWQLQGMTMTPPRVKTYYKKSDM